jgi:hypothetical protein
LVDLHRNSTKRCAFMERFDWYRNQAQQRGKELCLKRGYDRQGVSNYAHSNVFFASTMRFSGSLVVEYDPTVRPGGHWSNIHSACLSTQSSSAELMSIQFIRLWYEYDPTVRPGGHWSNIHSACLSTQSSSAELMSIQFIRLWYEYDPTVRPGGHWSNVHSACLSTQSSSAELMSIQFIRLW